MIANSKDFVYEDPIQRKRFKALVNKDKKSYFQNKKENF